MLASTQLGSRSFSPYGPFNDHRFVILEEAFSFELDTCALTTPDITADPNCPLNLYGNCPNVDALAKRQKMDDNHPRCKW